MNSSRRAWLRCAASGLGGLGLCSCERALSGWTGLLGQEIPARLATAAGDEIDPDFHLLSRAGFGPWPGELERLNSMGQAEWLEEQLHPEEIDDGLCDWRARRFESLHFSAGDAYELKKEVLRDELTRHTLLRAIYSKRQLFEIMVEFWTDHLNIDLEKGDCIYLKPSDDRDVIRQHALGKFRDLIRASATSPAMLVYLDGKSNKVRPGQNDVPNENYARELLELHTLGVHGGYSQSDVREAARCLSGWTFDVKRKFAWDRGRSFFRANWHDDGEKTVLGIPIPAGGGEGDLERLIDLTCSQPSTARNIAQKLCRRFVSADPPEELVARVAEAFTRSGGDIKTVLRVLLRSEAFLQTRGNLFKRPYRFVVSALRLLGADTHAPANSELLRYLTRMGHGLFQCPTPDGYPQEEAPWMGTLMWRWNFALALSGNQLGGVRVDPRALGQALRGEPGASDKDLARRWFAHLTGRRPTSSELQAIQWASGGQPVDRQGLSLMLSSPAFQRF